MMEQTWVTDKFYSHFPSCTDEYAVKRKILLQSRKQDYQIFLKQMLMNDVSVAAAATAAGATTYNTNRKNQHRKSNNDIEVGRAEKPKSYEMITTRATIETGSDTHLNESERGRSSRPRGTFDAKHMDLPDLFDDEAIKERNRRVAEEDQLRKIEYQRDLLQQIEQKKKDTDRQKAKEKEYEDKLTRKLEEHLRTVRLEEENEAAVKLQQYRQRNHNQYREPYLPAYRNDFLNEIESHFKSSHHILDKRKAQSENGKENYLINQKTDKGLYNYFTNSARNYVEPEYSQDDLSSIASSLQYANTKKTSITDGKTLLYCRQCQREIIPNECNHCKFGHREIIGNLPDDFHLCSNCRNCTLCSRCMREICSKCRKRKKPKVVHLPNEETHTAMRPASSERGFNVGSASIPPARVRHPLPSFLYDENDRLTNYHKQQYHQHDNHELATNHNRHSDESDSDRELDVDLVSPVVIKHNNAPYSLYLEKSSIFHPSRNANDSKLSVSVKNGEVFVEKDARDDFEEIRRITNEKMSKYGKYSNNELSGTQRRQRNKNMDDNNHLPLPSISELTNNNRTKGRNASLLAASVRDSPAFKMLEQLELDESELDQFIE